MDHNTIFQPSGDFPSLKSVEGLEFWDQYFLNKSYAFDFEPTQNDAQLFRSSSGEPPLGYQNLRRWFFHIRSIGGNAGKGLNDLPLSNVPIKIAKSAEVEAYTWLS